MAAELPRPGVEVIQVFRSVSPTIIVPTLVPCVVGVCRQIVEVLTTTATGGRTLNSDALVPLQAGFTAAAAIGSPPVYASLDALHLDLSLNGSPDIVITFAGSALTPKQIVATVLAAFAANDVAAYTAETVGTTQWRLRSFAANEFQDVKVRGTSSPAVLAAFGLGAEKDYVGSSFYDQHITRIGVPSFPDPRRNLSQIVIDPDSVRAFFYLGSGSSLLEVQPSQSFLRGALNTPARLVGSVVLSSLTYPTDIGVKVLNLKINGGTTLVTTFASPANVAAALVQLNAVIGAVATATLDASGHLVVTTALGGPGASIEVLAGTAASVIGVSIGTVVGATAVAAVDDGNGDAVTPILNFPGQSFTSSATAAQVVGTAAITSGVADGTTLTLDDGNQQQTLTFTGANSGTLVLAQINALFGAAAGGRLLATMNGSSFLVLTNTVLGDESVVKVVGGTSLGALFITAQTVRGTPYPVRAGDDLYIDGALFGTVTQVAPGGTATQLKINKQVSINANLGASFFLQAKGLSGLSGRPLPDLTVDGLGNLTIKADVLRDTRGLPLTTARAQIYVSYNAVRRDVTSYASSPGLLRFNDTTSLESQLSPVTPDNPLALGIYFALLNAPGIQITGLGVDEATGAAPFGTVEGYARAATFLEGFEVYAIAPLTHDNSVGQIFNTHVSVMSDPENKGERICLFNQATPTTKIDTLIASGTRGQTTGVSNVFDTGVPNLGALLLANGISPVGLLAVSGGVYLDIGDGKKYSVSGVSGGVLTVKTTSFATGDNDDGYYATTTLPTPLIDEAFAVRIRGVALVLSDGAPDKEAIALTVQQQGQGYQNRRFWPTFPDRCAATLGGIEQVLEGFYLNAATVGAIGKQPPQQSFTNFPMTGFTRVLGSNDTFTEKQLNKMAAGGTYIFVQDEPNTPIISRMALTSDMTSIETRTDSITKVIDFTSKFMRRGLKNFIGRFNITQGFLDSLGHVQQGLGGFLVESGVLVGYNLNNIIQDEGAPDTVLTDSTLDVPFPCNYIRLTLVV